MGRKPTDIPTQQMFHWIGAYIQINGYPPTIREIRDGLGYHSTSAVMYVLERLRDEEYLSWEPGKSRTLRLHKPL